MNGEVKLQNEVKPSITAGFGGAFYSRRYGLYLDVSGTIPNISPAYLGNLFIYILNGTYYICPGPVFLM